MKILELNLQAFGPFTDARLDLSGGSTGFHMIYGRNEGGKTSSLRAIKALLYGIPHNTADNFLHNNQALRLGGRLRHSDGSEIRFLRRKGTKNTLLSPDGKALDDRALERFLGGVGETVFTTMFGISHDVLVSGGQDLLLGGGEVGQSLFAAGLGTSGLPAFLKELESEMRALFLPSGANPTINRAMADYKQAKRLVAQLSLPSREWSGRQQALQEAQEQEVRVKTRLAELSKEKSRLERFAMALPKIGRRAELLERQERMGEVVLLSPEFSTERREALENLRPAEIGSARAERELEDLELQAENLQVLHALLNQGKTINDLYQRLGAHLKARQDLTGLEGGFRELESKAGKLLAKLRPDLTLGRVEEIRLTTAAQLTIRELANQNQALETKLARARQDAEGTGRDLEATRKALIDMPVIRDPHELRLAIGKAQKRGDLEELQKSLQKDFNKLEVQVLVNLQKLGLWSGTLKDLEKLPVPGAETVNKFEALLGDQERVDTQLAENIAAAREEVGKIKKQLEALRLAGEVPSEEDLIQARGDRDHGWQLIRKNWLAQEDVSQEIAAYDPEQGLADAYETRVSFADDIADRLRREAERVAAQANLLAELQAQKQKVNDLAAEQKESRKLLDSLWSEWRDLWKPCGIRPLSPREMRVWVNNQQKLAQEAEKLRSMQADLEGVGAEIAAQRASLSQALSRLEEPEPGDQETLEVLLDRCRQVVTTIDDKVRERDSLQESLPGLKRKLTQARQDQEIAEDQMKKWTDSWTKAIKPLKLQGEASPAVVNVLLSDMEELFRNVDKAAHDRGRITGIKQDAEHFRTDVRDLVGHIAPDLIELAPEQAVAELHARLTKTQQDAAKLESLEGQIEAKKKLIEETDLIIQAEKMKLDALCQQAGCSDYHDLEDIEKSSQEFQNLRQDVKSLEDQILEQSAGVALEEFIRESDTIDGDAIPGQEEQITRDLTELDQERDELHGTIVEIKVELARMDGNARAAEEADRAQEILAKMRDDVDHYVRLKLGWLILQRQIERYREENEGALINRAGDLFASLTLGSFASLAVDYNDRDDPILQGVRPTGKRVGVEGMSDGTVDPLYLALRLATLERYLENHEPMPFIVDDILIKLDDHRAEATLKVLHGLSHKTQVIFFTHHQRLVELAQNLGTDNSIFIHRLS